MAHRRLAEATLSEIAQWSWQVREKPVLKPPFPSPIIADPTFLPPERTPDGLWRLWAHSMLGLHAYTSWDGLAWRKESTVVRNALRPHLFDGSPFRLTYERTRLFLPLGLPWRSWLELRNSADLRTWSMPTTILEPTLDWHTGSELGEAVSNPCLIELPDGGWRLYYSAGLTLLPDCGFPEPTYIGVAHADAPEGPYTPDPEPLFEPGDGPASLAAGAIKVLRVRDGWLGFQNAITWDGTHSGSEIHALGSEDGLAWRPLRETPVLAPEGTGWRSSHVYALDVRDTDDGPTMYFNARDGYHWTKGRERIGRARAVTA